ncbi:hypothetical protein [Hymenobacter glaciei]
MVGALGVKVEQQGFDESFIHGLFTRPSLRGRGCGTEWLRPSG